MCSRVIAWSDGERVASIVRLRTPVTLSTFRLAAPHGNQSFRTSPLRLGRRAQHTEADRDQSPRQLLGATARCIGLDGQRPRIADIEIGRRISFSLFDAKSASMFSSRMVTIHPSRLRC